MTDWLPLHKKLDLTPPEVMVAQHFQRISTGSQAQPAQYRKSKRVQASDVKTNRDFAAVGDVMEQLFEKRGWKAELGVGEIVARWPEIVGPNIAANCSPKTFEDGVLTIQVVSTSWATQLEFMKADFLRRLNHEIGAGVIRELTILPPQVRSWKKGYRSVPGRGPRDTYG